MLHALQGVLILIAAGVSAAFVPSPAPVLGRRIHLSGRPVRFGLCCADASHATEAAACSGPPASQFWEWRYNSRIHYTQAGDTGPPIVLLTGFGVGGFHYARNIEVLGKAHRVWTMDILGQGQSWPQADPAPGGGYTEGGFQWGFGPNAAPDTDAADLNYSCSLWADQIIAFVESVVKTGPVYIAGNSLGGYLAVMVASQRPDLIRGLFLMNPTPFWGVGIQRILPWTGGYPVPTWVRPVTITWWDTIRNPSTIGRILGGVYANKDRVGQELIQSIIEPTEAPAAASAFASILCSPSSAKPFAEMLAEIRKSNIPVALTYGKEDPWIVPVWGYRAKRSLPSAKYWEISPAGHCPHHEAPEAVNYLLTEWIRALDLNDPAILDGLAPRTIAFDEVAFGRAKSTSGGFEITERDANPRGPSEWLDALVYSLRHRFWGGAD